MVLGTSSGAGKSLMTAALCRVLLRRGDCPLPFKGQNMSLNAWVDGDGGEMAYSQAMQAWAAGLEPCCAMNPVLLKPQGDSTSEVILNGRPAGIARAETYYQEWFRPGWQAIRRGLAQLEHGHPTGRLVLEGAGSPVEMNLQPRDLTNLRLAQFLRARCLLVADIERGGVFAQIVGTLSLLRPVERPLIRGILINRFRGRRELFDNGRRWLEERTGVPVLGVMPWLNDLFPPEDSLDLLERRRHKPEADLEIAVLRLPSLSNFSDLDPLEAEPWVRLRWVRPGSLWGNPMRCCCPAASAPSPTWPSCARRAWTARCSGSRPPVVPCSACAEDCRCLVSSSMIPRDPMGMGPTASQGSACCPCAPASPPTSSVASGAAAPSGPPGPRGTWRGSSCTGGAARCWPMAWSPWRMGRGSVG